MPIDRQIIRKITLASGIAFILLLGFFLLLHYIRLKSGRLNFKISKGYISLKRIDYKFFKKGVLAYEIFSKNLNYKSQRKNIVKLKGVKGYIYGKNKKPAYIITGKYGRINSVSKNVAVSGDVIIKYLKGTQGTRMKTDLIRYEAKEDRIIAPDNIKIKGKNYYITGKGLIFYVKKNIFVLQKNVHFISNDTGGVVK